MKYYNEESYLASQGPTSAPIEEEFGCGFCWDKRAQKDKEIFFFDAANNMRICKYCPYCGRAL